MNERFDDMIRRQLEGHESEVPDGLFDAIRNQPEVQDAFFDDTLRSKLVHAETNVPSEAFNAIDASIELAHLGFDSAVREKMENHSSAVPAAMWQQIMAEKDRRRRPVALWWVAAAVLLLGVGMFFLIQHTNTLPAPVIVVERKETNQNNIHPVEQPGKKNHFSNEEANSKPVKHSITPQPDSAVSSNSVQNTTSPINQNKLSASHLQVSADRQRNGGKRSLFGKALSKQRDMSEDSTNEPGKDLQPHSALQVADENSPVTTQLSILEMFRGTARLAPDQLLKAKPHAPVIPCPTNGDEKRSAWYVDVYGSAFLLQKNIQDKGTGKNAKAGFDSTLHQQISFNAGFHLVKKMGDNFLLKTGLQYNRMNENFRLTQINERRLITTISVRTVILSPGDTVRIRDTSTVEQIGTAQHRHQNTYTQWDIPVIIGYEFGGENIRINANAGLITNIRSSYQGEILADSTRQIVDINNYNGTPLYRKTVGFSLYAGLSILKPLSEQMNLLIEPHARFGLGNTTNNTAWFNQKNNVVGLSIGLRYKFGGSRQRLY